MRPLRFAAVMLASLSMAMAFSHLLQLPVRMDFGIGAWLTTQRLFPLFGSVGAVLEVGAVAAATVLAFAARRRPAASRRSIAGAASLSAALAVWILFVAPANAEIAGWTSASAPADWTAWRAQWEYAHAARAVLLILGLGLLLESILVETP